jgi:predicted lipoprotein with Yx(FWY)xxD motif
MPDRNILKLLFYSGLTGIFASCSKSDSPATTPPVMPPISVQVKTDSHFGSVLTDEKGKTLYFFSNDASDTSTCSGGCLVSWPAFYKDNATFDASLTKTDFGTISHSDGSKQITYKGWPLYYFQNDANAGDILGDGVGGIWFVAKPDYSVMLSSGQLVGNDGVQYDSTYVAGTGKTQYLTDDRGVTLYSFSFDSSANNNYTAADFSNDSFWPIVQITTIGSVPSIVDKSWFSTISVFGKTQMTFKGWPVYHFGADDLTRGNTKGVSVPHPGVWPVMNQYSPLAPVAL